MVSASENHVRKLEAYDSPAYTWAECTATLNEGSVLQGVRTFTWAGNAKSRELGEGNVDVLR
jgi:hypothetical protein